MQVNFFNWAPFFLFSLFLAAGIASADFLFWNINALSQLEIFISIFIILAVVLIAIVKKFADKLWFLGFFILGFSLNQWQLNDYNKAAEINLINQKRTFRIDEISSVRNFQFGVCEAIESHRFYAFFTTDSSPLLPGDLLTAIVSKQNSLLKSTNNPFQKRLIRKGIGAQLSLKHIQKVSFEPSLLRKGAEWNAYFSNKIDSLIPSKKDSLENGVAKALVLGNKNHLNAELKGEYATLGALHALAVSGAHLLLFIALFTLIAKPFKKTDISYFLFQAFLLIVIWLFTFITGAGPSIVRAAIMASITLSAQMMVLPDSKWNNLFISSFFMLIFRPHWLFDVGFQLSFLAMGGIFAIPSRWFQWMDKKPSWQKFLLNATLIGLAANIAVLPLVLHLFHLFPLYALLANVWIAISAGPLLGLGVIVCVFPVEIIRFLWLDKLYTLGLQINNDIIHAIASLPLSKSISFFPNEIQVGLFYLIIISLYCSFYFRNKYMVYVSLALSLFWAFYALLF